MLVALDLTTRQANRVLAQATRTHAQLEIEPRPLFLDSPLTGTLESGDRESLSVLLTNAQGQTGLATLVGAMCDVRAVLSGQLYLFSAAVLEATDASPARLRLSVPQSIQVANRRQYSRRGPSEPVAVRLTVPEGGEPYVGQLANLSRNGLGCRVLRRDLDDLLLIGDTMHVEFVLPWAPQIYALPVTICTKSNCFDKVNMLVGLEFAPTSAAEQATLEVLRATLDSETTRLTDTEGETL
jgi:hypothetical protein